MPNDDLTPRTDAVVSDGWTLCGIHVVSADFARQLERENAKLLEIIRKFDAAWDGAPGYPIEEARAVLAKSPGAGMTATACWHCNQSYPIADARCPHCCATNANVDEGRAQEEAESPSLIEHDWHYIKDCIGDPGVINGLQHFEYYECAKCCATKNGPPPQREYEPEDA